MIRIGDKVRITDPDQCYQEEIDWVYDYVSDKRLAIGYDLLGRPNDDDTGTVKAVWNTEDEDGKVYYVQVDDCWGKPSPYCYIMDETGIELIASDIKPGDIVTFSTDNPDIYDTYAVWVAKNVDDKEMIARYAFGTGPLSCYMAFKKGEKFRVITVAKHGSSSTILVYIRRLTLKGECYLVSVNHLKKASDIG